VSRKEMGFVFFFLVGFIDKAGFLGVLDKRERDLGNGFWFFWSGNQLGF